MRIGALEPWDRAGIAAGFEAVGLARPVDAMPAPQEDPVASRLRDGRAHLAVLTDRPVDFIADCNCEGLGFLPGPGGAIELLHERLGVPLVSHLTDPVLSCMRGLPPVITAGCLARPSWIKLVFDREQQRELSGFGFPGVGHLRQGAPETILEHGFVREPLDLSTMTTPVAFVGSQSSNYFGPQMRHQGDHQLAGAMILARRAEAPESSFWHSYHERYAIAPPPAPGDPPEVLAQKLNAYFGHKLFYVAMLWVAQRNRYVRFLSRQLGDDFCVWGRNWEGQGVRARARVSGDEGFLRLFRSSLININLNNGNTETGLNRRAFEITGAGGFMLCAHCEELGESFRVGEECDSFRNEDELLEKIAYYRAHPRRVVEMARAGQERTLREHMESHRLRTLVELVASRAVTAAA